MYITRPPKGFDSHLAVCSKRFLPADHPQGKGYYKVEVMGGHLDIYCTECLDKQYKRENYED